MALTDTPWCAARTALEQLPASFADRARPARVVIVSADVAGGHDAAAHALGARLELLAPGIDCSVHNGLATLGPRMHRVLREGYERQLRYAGWSWRLAFALLGTRLAALLTWFVTAHLFGRRFARHLPLDGADLVVSTYPGCTSVLAALRRSGKLRAPLLATVSDVNPHRMWFAPGVDLHLLCAPGDVERCGALVPWAAVQHAPLPVGRQFPLVATRAAARRQLGLPAAGRITLVSGGSWGAGPISAVTDELARGSDGLVVALCGCNDRLRAELALRHAPERVRALGFTEEMPALMRAADVLVTTGPGMTVFEAVASGLPIAMAGAIPGHGERSARGMEQDGLIVRAHANHDLHGVVRDLADGRARLPLPAVARPMRRQRPRTRPPMRTAGRIASVLAACLMLATSLVGPLPAEAREVMRAARGRIASMPHHLPHHLPHHAGRAPVPVHRPAR